LIASYRESLSFNEVAKRFNLRRSAMRMVLRELPTKLTKDDLVTMAVRSYVTTLLVKRHAEHHGLDERRERKLRDVKIKDADSLGAFDQRISKRPNPSFFPSAHC
jgi:tRNA (Thr-GGU) A37 N-methylase